MAADRPPSRRRWFGSTIPRPTRWAWSTTPAIWSGSTSPAPSISGGSGMSYRELEAAGLRLAVSEVAVRYRQPARYRRPAPDPLLGAGPGLPPGRVRLRRRACRRRPPAGHRHVALLALDAAMALDAGCPAEVRAAPAFRFPTRSSWDSPLRHRGHSVTKFAAARHRPPVASVPPWSRSAVSLGPQLAAQEQSVVEQLAPVLAAEDAREYQAGPLQRRAGGARLAGAPGGRAGRRPHRRPPGDARCCCGCSRSRLHGPRRRRVRARPAARHSRGPAAHRPADRAARRSMRPPPPRRSPRSPRSAAGGAATSSAACSAAASCSRRRTARPPRARSCSRPGGSATTRRSTPCCPSWTTPAQGPAGGPSTRSAGCGPRGRGTGCCWRSGIRSRTSARSRPGRSSGATPIPPASRRRPCRMLLLRAADDRDPAGPDQCPPLARRATAIPRFASELVADARRSRCRTCRSRPPRRWASSAGAEAAAGLRACRREGNLCASARGARGARPRGQRRVRAGGGRAGGPAPTGGIAPPRPKAGRSPGAGPRPVPGGPGRTRRGRRPSGVGRRGRGARIRC